MRRAALTLCIAGTVAALAPARASADTCWLHNGSLMRLVANGAARMFYYEAPRPNIEQAGGRRGVLLFDGVRMGDRYSGTARVFNEHDCLDTALEYRVTGRVGATETRIVLSGSREVYKTCAPTGRAKVDRLVFTYSRQC